MRQLRFGTKLSYAMGGMALNLANLVISQWLMKLYVPSRDSALVAGALFAGIFFSGRLMDGIIDPVAGFVSDHFKSKRGRRIPFIAAMTIPAALVSFLLWVPPYPDGSHWLNAVYLFVMVQLFFICWTFLANPYMALLPEITSDLDERVNITTMQAVFLMIGTFIFGAMGAIKDELGWIGIGAVTGALTLVSFFPTVFTIKEKSSIGRIAKERFRFTTIMDWTRTTFKNRSFVILVAATSSLWFALNMVILVVPFWVQYALDMTDREVVLLMAPLLVVNIVFFFVFNYIAKRLGKFTAFVATLASAAVTMPLLGLSGYLPFGDMMLQSQIAMALVGIPVSGIMVLPPALLADVIDHDETLTGKRREGIYFGVQAIFQKIAIGLSIAVATALMYGGGSETASVWGLRMISVSAGAAALVSLAFFTRYPIREKDGKAFVRN
ncbi:MAG TPA: MFS transporter [Spirochaetota bacterium]|nr:MFS transporter [Spirochaetota bacterium]